MTECKKTEYRKMTGQEEILPPDPTVEGWWWLAIDDAKRPFRWVPWPATKSKTSIRAGFWRGLLQDMSPEVAHKNRWKLIAPVATPEEVDALRAALEDARSNNDNLNVEVTDLRAENAKLRRALGREHRPGHRPGPPAFRDPQPREGRLPHRAARL